MGGLSNAEYNRRKDAAFFAALATGDPGDLRWTERAGHRWPNRGGSENIAAEQHALQLFRPETREQALGAWGWWAERSRTAFEGIEYGSRIYRSRTLAAHLLARRWALREAHPDMMAFLRDWLRLYWTLELLSSLHLHHGVQSMRTGARSAGHALHPLQSDYALALAGGGRFTWTKPWKFLGPQNKEAEGNLARQLRALEPEIVGSAQRARLVFIDFLGSRSAELGGAWGTLATTHYYRTRRGVVVWVEHQEGGNTVGIAAMGCDEGGEPWCIGPSPAAWARKERAWRQKGYELSCGVVTSPEPADPPLLVANGRVAGAALPRELHPLPTGELIYHVVHDASGLHRLA